jgi:hypothetical protein
MEALESALQDAEATGMQVWYYRDNPAAQPSSEAFEVFKRIVSHNVPVSLSSRPDFSDYIDEHGNSKQRDAE